MLTEAIGPFSLYLDCSGRVSSRAPRLGRYPDRRGGRVVEGAPLLRAYGSKAHRGFESLPLRHTARQFPPASITQSWQPRSGDSNPGYEQGGSTKSPKAILDDAEASPEGRGPKARVNPSLSATRHVNSRRGYNASPCYECIRHQWEWIWRASGVQARWHADRSL